MLELNKIYCMDALELLKQLPDKSVDLCLTDPPYNLNKGFDNDNLEINEFISFMNNWIIEAKRVLKEDGIICVFGKIPLFFETYQLLRDLIFINHIVWQKKKGINQKRCFLTNREDILVFGMSNNYNFNVQYSDIKPIMGGRQYKEYIQKGKEVPNKLLTSVWTDIIEIDKNGERVEHPTQKPMEIMTRLILAFSNKEDLVLDCFMGSGTTALACQQLGRNFIGCDNKEEYVKLANERLSQKCLLDKSSEKQGDKKCH